MAMRKDQIPDNKFTLPLDARELALYTRQITKNAKTFDLEIDASLPGQLRATADRIFLISSERTTSGWTSRTKERSALSFKGTPSGCAPSFWRR